MVTPLPRVMKPAIFSPGNGEQHFAKLVRTFCSPWIKTGELGLDRIREMKLPRVVLCGLWVSGAKVFIILLRVVVPPDIARYNCSGCL